MGVQQAVALCMDHCLSADITDDEGWFKTIVLAGGSACLPGLAGTVSIPHELNFLRQRFKVEL